MRPGRWLLLVGAGGSAACSVIGNWTSPPSTGKMRIEVTAGPDAGGFTVRYGSGNQWGTAAFPTAAGGITYTTGGKTYQGVLFASAFAQHAPAGAAAPDACSWIVFGGDPAPWCRFPYCPQPQPAWAPWPPVPAPPAPTPPPPPPAPTPSDPPTAMTTVEVPNAVALGAVLPDGSPFAYTINYRPDATGWVVHMSGGGWAFLKNGTAGDGQGARLANDGLAAPSSSSLGSCYGICDGIMSNDPTVNPDFAGWNKVFIPIGDRTAFTGDRWGGKPLFRGRRNLDATLADLMLRYNMSAAADVVLTGGSSGGHATYLQCDRVGGLVGAGAPGARFACLADAGFFLFHDTATPGVPAATNAEFAESFYAWNSSAAVNAGCLAHYAPLGTPEKCIFAQHVLPFIKSRLFVMQNLYDSWQLANILGLRCSTYNKDLSQCGAADMDQVQRYGADMRALLATAVANPAVGVYATSCIAHCQSVENEHPQALWHWPGRWGINGTTAGLADGAMRYPRGTFGDWYFGRTAAQAVAGEDDPAAPRPHTVEQLCDWGPSCNALCPLFT